MKGFGIEIKNNLLEPKHIKNMDVAVWLYMFLIDKITSINEKGEGIVLGGKPIKYKEIKDELGISQNTYTRWMDRLEEYPYIITTRTPYGICYKVLKAYKRIKKRFTKTGDSPIIKRDSPETGGDSPEMVKTKKTIQDTTSRLSKNSFSYKKVFNDKEWRAELSKWRRGGGKVIKNKKFILKDGKKLLLDQNGKWQKYNLKEILNENPKTN